MHGPVAHIRLCSFQQHLPQHPSARPGAKTGYSGARLRRPFAPRRSMIRSYAVEVRCGLQGEGLTRTPHTQGKGPHEVCLRVVL